MTLFSSDNVLGCGSYDVALQARGGGSVAMLLPWTSVSWSRVLNDTSQASFTAASFDDSCYSLLQSIKPWKHELAIFRNGEQVWVGPLIDELAPASQLTGNARDISTWWDRRLIHEQHRFLAPVDLSVIFKEISDDAMLPDNTPGLVVSPTDCGVLGDVSILPEQHLMAGAQLRDLASTAIDWTTVNREVLVGGATVPTPSVSLLTDDSFMSPPTIHLDGSSQANSWIVRGAGGGAAGDVIFGGAHSDSLVAEFGLLEQTYSDTSIQDSVIAAVAAQSRLALTGGAIVMVDQAVLSPNASVTIDELVPGAVCSLWLRETTIPVRADYRLQKVDVNASGDGAETVSLTLQPLGSV